MKNKDYVYLFKRTSNGAIVRKGIGIGLHAVEQELPLCTHIRNHSPSGFEWGYSGSGPTQLALALLVDIYGEDLNQHPMNYFDFRDLYLADKLRDNWHSSPAHIDSVIKKHLSEKK